MTAVIDFIMGAALIAAQSVGLMGQQSDDVLRADAVSAAAELRELTTAARTYAETNYATYKVGASIYGSYNAAEISLSALINTGNLRWTDNARKNRWRHSYTIVVKPNTAADTTSSGTSCGSDPAQTCPLDILVLTYPAPGAGAQTLPDRDTGLIARELRDIGARIEPVSGVLHARRDGVCDFDLSTITYAAKPAFAAGYPAACTRVAAAAQHSAALTRYPTAQAGDGTVYKPVTVTANGATTTLAGNAVTVGSTSLTATGVTAPSVTVGSTALTEAAAREAGRLATAAQSCATGLSLIRQADSTWACAIPSVANATTLSAPVGTFFADCDASDPTKSYVCCKSGTIDSSGNRSALSIYAANLGLVCAPGKVCTSSTGCTTDSSLPTVIATTPTNNATGVSEDINPAVTFSENMDPNTISGATMTITPVVSSSVAYDVSTRVATLILPTLQRGTNYTVSISGAKDLVGNAMAPNFTLSFKTIICGYTQNDIDNGNLCSGGATRNCTGVVVGEYCGGGVYAGQFNGYHLVVVPGGCTDSDQPPCVGSTDSITKYWDGANLRCNDLQYHFDDWYLPTLNELRFVIENQSIIGGFTEVNHYWSSSKPYGDGSDYRSNLSKSGVYSEASGNSYSLFFRCVRRAT